MRLLAELEHQLERESPLGVDTFDDWARRLTCFPEEEAGAGADVLLGYVARLLDSHGAEHQELAAQVIALAAILAVKSSRVFEVADSRRGARVAAGAETDFAPPSPGSRGALLNFMIGRMSRGGDHDI